MDSPPHSLKSLLVLGRRKDRVYVARHPQAISSRTSVPCFCSLRCLFPKRAQISLQPERKSERRVCACACMLVRLCSGISIKDGSVARDEGARRQIHTLSDV